MRTATLTVARSGHAVVQDLGRPGYAALGVSVNGAADQRSARTANTLVGNADGSALVEVTGSDLDLVTDSPLVLAVTGATEGLWVDGHRQPAWETLLVPPGARLSLPAPRVGQRSYLAVNGTLEAERVLGSVAPDSLLGVGRRLEVGDRCVVTTAVGLDGGRHHLPLFRLGARPSHLGARIEVQATPGPDLDRLAGQATALDGWFEVSPQSDHVGIRLAGERLRLTDGSEILSRGVPVGAVQVPPSGELVILMRGRLVTAGYPIVAVVTTASRDALAQARPGDRLRLSLVDLRAASTALEAQESEHRALAGRVAAALVARGLGCLLSSDHASNAVPRREPA